jgi:uncharacterized protein (DUF2132 family)
MDIKYTSSHKSNQQENNPLHGVKLVTIIEFLVADLGWEEMGNRVNINCFQSNQTVKSSLKFLRTTPWAREKVEKLYLDCLGESK